MAACFINSLELENATLKKYGILIFLSSYWILRDSIRCLSQVYGADLSGSSASYVCQVGIASQESACQARFAKSHRKRYSRALSPI